MSISRKTLSITLAAAMVISMSAAPGKTDRIEAAKKSVLKTKSVTLKVGQSAKIKFKSKRAKAKFKFSSNKKAIAAVSAKGVITAKKAGGAVITVKETFKKKTKKIGTVKVTVNAVELAPSATDGALQAPASTAPSTAPTQAPSKAPATTPTIAPTTEPTKAPESEFLPLQEFIDDDNFVIEDSNFKANNRDNAGTMESITYPSTVIKEGEIVMRKANVALPKDYDESKKYPVIYVAHGIGGNQDSMTGDGDIKNVLWNAVAEGVAEEAILVFPSCCANEYNGQGPNEFFSVEHYRGYNNFLNDFKECLKPYIDENYSTLPDRENTAICGFSMGGRVTLHLGFSLQDTFRYVGAFCPAPGILDFTDNGVTDKGLFEPQDFKLDDQYRDDTLVMIFKGKNDTVVKTFPKEYHDTLEDNDVPHVYLETMGGTDGTNGGGGHDGGVYNFGFYNFIKRIFKKR